VESTIEYKVCTGTGIIPYLKNLAALRIEVFREFPYLYDGSLEYEEKYLSGYNRNQQSIIVLAIEDEVVIGMSSGIPLISEPLEFQNVFLHNSIDPKSVFYFGESVLKRSKRGQGIGKKLMETRINYARDLGFTICAFCSVIRESNHPLIPIGYKPLDAFWTKYGFVKFDNMKIEFKWKDLDSDEETAKKMVFWLKDI
jgi:GNAT superfamily N-acetyltransferase